MNRRLLSLAGRLALLPFVFATFLLGESLEVGLAEAAEMGGGLAQTATAASPVADPQPVATVESRIFTKVGRFHVRLGATYLAREDFWISPGISLQLAFHPFERIGVEASATAYFSTLDAAAEEIRRTQGLLPDAAQPIARFGFGPRWAFAYGKLLIEDAPRNVLHFDLGLGTRLGGMVTDLGVNFGGDVSLSLEVSWGSWGLVWAELGTFVGFEDRAESDVHAGPFGRLGLGARL